MPARRLARLDRMYELLALASSSCPCSSLALFAAFRKSVDNFWPAMQLKRLALLPTMFNTFLGNNHTVPNAATKYRVTSLF